MDTNDLEMGDEGNPDAVLVAYTRALSDRYREKLRAAYVNPKGAYDLFRERAGQLGTAEAAIAMREQPGTFGELKDGGVQHAREAALIGARAYHAVIAQGNTRMAAEVIDGAFGDAVVAAGAEPDRVRETWDALRDAYGVAGASDLLRRRASDVFGPAARTEAVEHIVAFATARDAFRVRAGGTEPAASSRPLPRSITDEQTAPARLPDQLQGRLVAACDAMRKRLVIAYDNPLAAEARLHSLANRAGLTGIAAADHEPGLLGTLRHDHPGGTPAAETAARAALGYARIAYQYHYARGPEAAEEIAARDAVRGVQLSARDPERAMEGVHEAIRLHGPALEAHLARELDRIRNPRGPDRGGSEPGGGAPGSIEPGTDGSRRRTASAPFAAAAGSPLADDPAVEEVVRAFDAHEEAANLAGRGRRLREERTEAERVVARLADQDLALMRATRDFRAVAATVYVKPDDAMAAWDRLVLTERGHLERASEKVTADPTCLGTLRSEPRTGLRGRFGLRTTEQARAAVPNLARRATAHTQAERVVNDPVEWTTPEGETVRGRERVRAAALAVSHEKQELIAATDGRLKEIGGLRGTEVSANQAFQRLEPAQQARASSRVGPARVAGVLSTATRVAEVARAVRTVGEGPASL